MTITIKPGQVEGIIEANASKSAMQRACAAALLAGGITIIENPGKSNDDRAALKIIENLGAVISHKEPNVLQINSSGVKPVRDHIFCGESGLSIRMFTPIASMSDEEILIDGEGSLRSRPMDFFDDMLPKLDVKIESNEGKLPMRVKGPLQPVDLTVDGSLSSQFLTGLLMAYSAANATDVSIHVKNLKSKPYIDLTLQLMASFGMKVPENRDYNSFYFGRSSTIVNASVERTFRIEGDWSGAAFILVAGAIAGGEVLVKGINSTSRQADKRIVDALLSAGAIVKVMDDSVLVKKDKLMGFRFDATDCPDLFPPLVALAAMCKGETYITGLKRLKHKESDRGITLQEEFEKLGIRIELDGDLMIVYGKGKIRVANNKLNSHHDHRIAMAAAVAGLCADFEIDIRNADAVNKSYSDFWEHMQKLGAEINYY